jgi:hypothetical protein
MPRDRKRIVRDKDGQTAGPPVDTASSPLQSTGHHTPIRLSRLKVTKPPARHSQELARIRSCLRTVATLLETNHAYLPIFLRLEQELEAERLTQDAIARSRKYLSNWS